MANKSPSVPHHHLMLQMQCFLRNQHKITPTVSIMSYAVLIIVLNLEDRPLTWFSLKQSYDSSFACEQYATQSIFQKTEENGKLHISTV